MKLFKTPFLSSAILFFVLGVAIFPLSVSANSIDKGGGCNLAITLGGKDSVTIEPGASIDFTVSYGGSSCASPNNLFLQDGPDSNRGSRCFDTAGNTNFTATRSQKFLTEGLFVYSIYSSRNSCAEAPYFSSLGSSASVNINVKAGGGSTPPTTAGSRIYGLKGVTSAGTNATKYTKSLSWTFKPEAGDAALANFEVICDISKGTAKPLSRQTTSLCENYDKGKQYTVKVSALDSSKKPIGTPAQITISETTDGTPSVNPPTNVPGSNIPPIVDLKKPIVDFNNPVSDDFMAIIQRIVNTLLALIATVAVIFIVVGGFRLTFSQGNQEAVAKGKKTLTWAIAGLAVALLTFAIIRALYQLLN